MINKKIASELALGIVLLIAMALGGIFWIENEKAVINDQISVIESSQDQNPKKEEKKNDVVCTQEAKLCEDGSYVGRTGPSCEFAPCPKTSDEDSGWENVQFDGCGKKDKYEKLAWWNDFANQINQKKYYTDAYIANVLKSAENSDGVKYTYDSYCAKTGHLICAKENLEKKISEDDFAKNGQGCLSKDGAKFVAVLAGGYMGGGNYVFRYDVENKKLEESRRDYQDDETVFWTIPPQVFGKRVGSVIKMNGFMGDAGCSADTSFDFDFVKNAIKMTGNCYRCGNAEDTCHSYYVDNGLN